MHEIFTRRQTPGAESDVTGRDGRRRAKLTALSMLPVLAGGLLAGCSSSGGSGGSGGSAAAGTRSIKVGVLDNPANAALFYAQQHGYFSKAGLQISIKAIAPTEFVPAVTTGQVDASVGSLSAVYLARSKKIPLKMLFLSVMSTPDNCSLSVQVLKKSAVDSIAGLSGKTIAVASTGSSEDTHLNPVLQHAGVNLKSVKYLPVGQDGPADLAALQKGRADAMVLPEPFSSSMVAAGQSRVIGNVCQAPAPNPFGSVGYFAKASYLANNKQTIKLWEQSMEEASAYIAAHPDDYAAFVAKRFKLKLAAVKLQHPGSFQISDSLASFEYEKKAMIAAGDDVSGVSVSDIRTPLLTSSK